MTIRGLLVLAACASAQVHAPPRIGCYVDAGNNLRVVSGAAGNFIVSEPLREGVLSAWCTDRTIVKTADSLEVDGIVYAAPPGPARFRAGESVVGYENGEWVRILAGGGIEAAPPPEDPEQPDPVRVDGRFVTIKDQRIELPASAVSIGVLGQGWRRIVLEDGGHMALSIERLRVYRLPEVEP